MEQNGNVRILKTLNRSNWQSFPQYIYHPDLGGKLTKTLTTNKGVRQGCCLLPTLINIYIDDMLCTWKDQIISGIWLIKNICIRSILYADDMVIIQESEYELQRDIFKLNKITEEYYLKISTSKTKIMAFLGKYQITSKIVIKDDIIEQVRHFIYLGCVISCYIDNKLAKFRNVCGTNHKYLKHKTRKDTHDKFYKTITLPVLIYGSETWVPSKREESKLQSSEMPFLRKV
jgi:hypothetical protein